MSNQEQIFNIIKLLVACQVACLEYLGESVSDDRAKAALIERLSQATRLAKKLD